MVTRARALLLAVAVLLGIGLVPMLAAGAEPAVHFTAAGDFGTDTHAQGALAGMGSSGADLALAVGDLSYGVTGAEQSWCDLVTARVGAGYPFELLAGNHESDGINGNINDFASCLPNQLPGAVGSYGRQYYVDVPKGAPLVRFVMISPGITYPDSTWTYVVGSARYQWTAAAIDGARAAGIPWVVVGMHKPCLNLGPYTCDPGADITNLMLTKKVDLVLNGHEHLYQRTHQLATSATCPGLVPGAYNAGCVTDTDSSYVKGAGTVFATVGTGGMPLRAVNWSDPERPYFSTAFGSDVNAHGYLDVTATSTALTARFAQVDGATFADGFTVQAGGQPAPTTTTPAPTATTTTPAPTLASDSFTRTVTGGWGTATSGAPWTSTGSTVRVDGSRGLFTLAKGTSAAAWLPSISPAGADVTATVTVTPAPAGGSGVYPAVTARRTSAGEYRAKLRVTATGSDLALVRTTSTGVETTIAAEVPVSGAVTGAPLAVRVQAVGANPTTVRARAWSAGAAEPGGWPVQATDATAGLQGAGSVGFSGYLSGSTTNGPITVAVDDLTVRTP